MKLTTIFLISFVLIVGFNNCAKNMGGFAADGGASVLSSSGSAGITDGSDNSVAVKVGNCGYVNAPCVSVTICSPGTNSSCQTIPRVLLDTGSYGLRLFSSLITVNLNPAGDPANSSRVLSQCTTYADGTSQWGPVKKADVKLGQQKASNISIQLIDATYAGVPSTCTNLDTTPAEAGYNGILGVGVFIEDCGPSCQSYANNRIYFSCASGACTNTTVPLSAQVSNPVAAFPTDNNGIILQLPSISNSGAVQIEGVMYFGIGTRANNQASNVNVLNLDARGDVSTTFLSNTYASSYIDSGSNGLFFPGNESLPNCANNGFFCPTSEVTFAATISGAMTQNVSFSILNGDFAFSDSNPNWVFKNLGANLSGGFVWGLPFFLGRTVFVGFEKRNSVIGQGPSMALSQ